MLTKYTIRDILSIDINEQVVVCSVCVPHFLIYKQKLARVDRC